MKSDPDKSARGIVTVIKQSLLVREKVHVVCTAWTIIFVCQLSLAELRSPAVSSGNSHSEFLKKKEPRTKIELDNSILYKIAACEFFDYCTPF